MFLILIYLIAVITWGWVLFDLVKATLVSIRRKTDTPRLLIPLAFSSLALFTENLYFLIANIVRYIFKDEKFYQLFIFQDNVFMIKLFIAVGGLLMVLKMRSERKGDEK